MPDPEFLTELHMAEWWLCHKCNRRLLWRLDVKDTEDGVLLIRPDDFPCECGEVYHGEELPPTDTCPGASWDCPYCGEENNIFPPTEDDIEQEEMEDEDGSTVRVTKHKSEYEIESEQTCRHCKEIVYVAPCWISEDEDENDE